MPNQSTTGLCPVTAASLKARKPPAGSLAFLSPSVAPDAESFRERADRALKAEFAGEAWRVTALLTVRP